MKRKTIPGLDTPINTIFCIGRNYENHAKEMGHTSPSEPIVFLKPISSICYSGTEIKLPVQSSDIHHEVELVIAIGKTGKDISKEAALDFITGYGIGIDFTARDLQKIAKKKGHPWSVAKGFDHFGPIGDFIPFSPDSFTELEFQLLVNGQVRQKGNTTDMIFDLADLISHLSSIFTLQEGDLIFTGTPEGVAAVYPEDVLEAQILGHPSTLTITISR